MSYSILLLTIHYFKKSVGREGPLNDLPEILSSTTMVLIEVVYQIV